MTELRSAVYTMLNLVAAIVYFALNIACAAATVIQLLLGDRNSAVAFAIVALIAYVGYNRATRVRKIVK